MAFNKDVMFASGNDDTETPHDFFKKIRREFKFVCDVAATKKNRKVPVYFGPDHAVKSRRDCLTRDWPKGPNWMNPPYSDPEHACKPTCKKKLCAKRGFHVYYYRPGCIDFVRKAAEQRARGVTTVALLAARTDNTWFHEYVWDEEKHRPRPGISVRFLKGRLKFVGADNSAPFPNMLVIFKGARVR